MAFILVSRYVFPVIFLIGLKMKEISIAVLLTCHNRRKKTERCLNSLKSALSNYKTSSIHLEIYLTDDGCSDGTSNAARSIFFDNNKLHILQGDGDLYWAGGMRFCWREAMKRHKEWDYYLLLNDDVELMDNLFDELFAAINYSISKFEKQGLVSGATCDINDSNLVTYGGSVWKNKFLSTFHMLEPSGMPQLCDLPNANILLVPSSVVDKIGIFYEGYQHGIADYDYGVMANKAGIPVFITGGYCGKCEHDHKDFRAEAEKVINMTLDERKVYFSNPIRSSHDHLVFIKRTSLMRYPIVAIGRVLNLYFPKFYYGISGIRNHDFRD